MAYSGCMRNPHASQHQEPERFILDAHKLEDAPLQPIRRERAISGVLWLPPLPNLFGGRGGGGGCHKMLRGLCVAHSKKFSKISSPPLSFVVLIASLWREKTLVLGKGGAMGFREIRGCRYLAIPRSWFWEIVGTGFRDPWYLTAN